jgi:hypothetical protein
MLSSGAPINCEIPNQSSGRALVTEVRCFVIIHDGHRHICLVILVVKSQFCESLQHPPSLFKVGDDGAARSVLVAKHTTGDTNADCAILLETLRVCLHICRTAHDQSVASKSTHIVSFVIIWNTACSLQAWHPLELNPSLADHLHSY